MPRTRTTRVLAVGQGTTGTHTIFNALCVLGVPSVHYRQECNTGSPCRYTKDRSLAGAVKHVPHVCGAEGLELYESKNVVRMRAMYDAAKEFVANKRDCTRARHQHLCNVTGNEWAAAARATVSALARDQLSLTDSPYAQMPSLLLSLPELVNTSLYVNSLRTNATEWATSRVREHNSSIMCRQEVFPNGDRLDLHACAEACGPNVFGDCLVRYDDMPLEALAGAYERSASRLRSSLQKLPWQRRVLTVDMFTTRIDTKKVSDLIQQAHSRSQCAGTACINGRGSSLSVASHNVLMTCAGADDEAVGCAALWPPTPPDLARSGGFQGGQSLLTSGNQLEHPPRAIVVTIFKKTRLATLVQFLEYYRLIGASRVVLVDNNCGYETGRVNRILAPYIHGGFVKLMTEYRCLKPGERTAEGDVFAETTVMRWAASKSARAGDLVLFLSDDEFLVLKDPAWSLPMLARQMHAERVCAVHVPWKQFGSGGHRCQPNGSLLRNFQSRGPLLHELTPTDADAMLEDAHNAKINPPFKGKPLFLWQLSKTCATHLCSDGCDFADFTVCGYPNGTFDNRSVGTKSSDQATKLTRSAVCPPLLRNQMVGTFINHYAYQSAAAWEEKKERGRVSDLVDRRGPVPFEYNALVDGAGFSKTSERISLLSPAKPSLQSCLRRLLADGVTTSRELLATGQTDRLGPTLPAFHQVAEVRNATRSRRTPEERNATRSRRQHPALDDGMQRQTQGETPAPVPVAPVPVWI